MFWLRTSLHYLPSLEPFLLLNWSQRFCLVSCNGIPKWSLVWIDYLIYKILCFSSIVINDKKSVWEHHSARQLLLQRLNKKPRYKRACPRRSLPSAVNLRTSYFSYLCLFNQICFSGMQLSYSSKLDVRAMSR